MEHEDCTRTFFAAWLDERVEPLTEEHRLLQALWSVGDEEERKRLVRTFIRARGREFEP